MIRTCTMEATWLSIYK